MTNTDALKPTEKEVLDLLERSRSLKVGGAWLNPAAIARNIGRARTHVSTTLSKMKDSGFVETDGDGYYRITETGTERLRDI